MKYIDPTWFVITSELFVNLSAFWLAGAISVPFSSDKEFVAKLGLLTANIIVAILSLVVAFILRRKGNYD